MSIRIKTEKTINSHGEYCKRITEIKALKLQELHSLYKYSRERPIVYKTKHGEMLHCRNRGETLPCESVYKVGEEYSAVSIQQLIRHCYEAGEHLMDCNKELAEKKKRWNGSETIII